MNTGHVAEWIVQVSAFVPLPGECRISPVRWPSMLRYGSRVEQLYEHVYLALAAMLTTPSSRLEYEPAQ